MSRLERPKAPPAPPRAIEAGTAPTVADGAPIPDDVPFELRQLNAAERYQRWVFGTVEPYLGQRVIEIGAGIGNMSRWLPVRERLLLTEAHPALLGFLGETLPPELRTDPRVQVLGLDILADDLRGLWAERLDTVVSFNVLEHIEDDVAALVRLCSLVRGQGRTGRARVLTFVPAHPWAFGEIDRSFEHFRRYSGRRLRALCREAAPDAQVELRYFNLVGLLGWVLKGRILRQAKIDPAAIALFDRLCPYIAPVDDFLHEELRLPLGQSLLAIITFEGALGRGPALNL